MKGWVIGVASALGIALVLAMALRARHVEGSQDRELIAAEPWMADARSEFGWPITAYRRFDVATPSNIRGRVAPVGLAADLGIVILLAVGPALAMAFTAGRRR